ncbi:MAG: phosphotransferase [Myxococcales bacterium]|nr:phosphotransferase [Myxococcales bacterium]
MDEPEPTRPQSAPSSGATHWSAIEPGVQLSATVVFAAGFALDPAHPVTERYEVTRRIGAGAMGQVLGVRVLGEQSQQSYALKLVARPKSGGTRASGGQSIPSASPHDDAATRWLTGLLRNEAAKQEAAQRHGVSVARFIALVRLDDGALGLRMEMARGRSWGALVDEEARRKSEPPDVHRAIRATRKLLGQLRRVHAIHEPGAPSGFVHSDIKPTNVFVDDGDPTDPSVTLLDFGVATAGRAAIDDEAALIGRETFVLRQTGGTPGYAPPGHFAARPSPASDVHAAIVCLYELLALSLPWDIDDIDPSPAAFAVIELRLSSPPKSVRARRPSIDETEAKVLDRYFAGAFSDLQNKALAWSTLLSAKPSERGEGESAHEARMRQMSDELSALAGEYQRSLDALAKELESLGITPRQSLAPPSLLSVQSGRATGSGPIVIEPLDTFDGASAVDTAPTLMASTKSEKNPDAWGDESDVREEKPEERRHASPAFVAAFALATVAIGAIALRSFFVSGTAPRAQADSGVRVDAASDVPTDTGVLYDTGVVDPGVSLDTAPTTPLDVGALPRAFRGRNAIAVITNPARGPSADAGRDASSAATSSVLCVASARGVRVVAHGGALDREVTLCTTDVLSDSSTHEYAGRAAMDPEVLRALPTVQCTGEGRWQTRVQRFAAGAGQAWLFTCVRPPPDPTPIESTPDASTATSAEPPARDAASSTSVSIEDASPPRSTPEDAGVAAVADDATTSNPPREVDSGATSTPDPPRDSGVESPREPTNPSTTPSEPSQPTQPSQPSQPSQPAEQTSREAPPDAA